MRVLFFCGSAFRVVAALISMALMFTFRPLGRPLKRENVLRDSKTEGTYFVLHHCVTFHLRVQCGDWGGAHVTAIRICARWFTFLFGPFHASVRESSRYLISSSAWITAAVLQQAWWFIHSQCLTVNRNMDLRTFALRLLQVRSHWVLFCQKATGQTWTRTQVSMPVSRTETSTTAALWAQ